MPILDKNVARKALKTQNRGGRLLKRLLRRLGRGLLPLILRLLFDTVKKIFKLPLDTFSQFDIIIMGGVGVLVGCHHFL